MTEKEIMSLLKQLNGDKTPKEKACEIVFKIYNSKKRPLISFWKDIRWAKKIAMIMVDELKRSSAPESIQLREGYIGLMEYQYRIYWVEVEKEIRQLTDF